MIMMTRSPRWIRLAGFILAFVLVLPTAALAGNAIPQRALPQTSESNILTEQSENTASYSVQSGITRNPYTLSDVRRVEIEVTATITYSNYIPLLMKNACAALPYNEDLLYNMDKINAPEAWPCAEGGKGIVIAILDTGADSDHPDLQANLVAGAYAYGSSTEDDQGHGTHVSGVSAGVANNGGILGVAPRASIMPVKVLNYQGSGTWTAIANGIIWAADHGAKVINMSLGGTSDTDTVHNAVIYAYNKSVAIIASAGNCGDSSYPYNGCSSMNQTAYPAAYPEVLAVAATDASDVRASFSTQGSYVDVSAPGVAIYSSYPWYYDNGLFRYLDGTSQAAPHVTGLAALIRKLHPTWTVSQVYAHIIATVDDVGPVGFDNGTGYGRINAQNAVNASSLAATDALPVPPAVQTSVVQASNDPAEFSPGIVLFKLRAGAALSSVLNMASIQSAGLQASVAVAALDVMQLQVPVGEEHYWLTYLRSLPDVAFAELDGYMYIQ
jgi:subtilisin family serine protease